jgi:selenocysteine lyase/cysteine desulfurase
VICDLDIGRLRAETPGCKEKIHFNNAGAGLMAQPVLDAMIAHLDLEARRGGYEASDAAAEAIADVYDATADLLGCAPRNIAFVSSATDAYARALSAVPFESGDVILATLDDFVSNQIAFLSLRKRFGVRIMHAATRPEGGVDVDDMVRLMREHRPRLVTATHIPTHSGLVQPVVEIGRHCRELGILYIVDACQSVGQRMIDVREIGCDFLTATYRKFLRGPRGTGFLFISDRVLEAGYEPLFLDMRGGEWTEPGSYRQAETAARFEDWEFGYASVIGSAVAVRYALDAGLDQIARRATLLGKRLRDGLASVDGIRVLDRGEDRCAIVTFVVEGWDSDEFMLGLAARNVNASISRRRSAQFDFASKGVDACVRLSPHYYNTEA